MKQLFIIGVASFVLIQTSCKKEEYRTPYENLLPKNAGTVSATLNGQPWKSNINLASYNKSNPANTFDFTARIFVDGYERQQLAIGRINWLSAYQKIHTLVRYDSMDGNYLVQPDDNCYSYFFAVDHDVTENAYPVYENEHTENYVKIESYDAATKKVKGSFQMSCFKYSTESPNTQGLPDTLHFTNGQFELSIQSL